MLPLVHLFHRSLSLNAAAAILMVPPQNTPKKKKRKPSEAQTQDGILNTGCNSRLVSSTKGHFYP